MSNLNEKDISYFDWENKFKKFKKGEVQISLSEIFSNSEIKRIIEKTKRLQNYMEDKEIKQIYVVQEKGNYGFIDKYGFFEKEEADKFCEEMNKDFNIKWYRVKPNSIKLILKPKKKIIF